MVDSARDRLIDPRIWQGAVNQLVDAIHAQLIRDLSRSIEEALALVAHPYIDQEVRPLQEELMHLLAQVREGTMDARSVASDLGSQIEGMRQATDQMNNSVSESRRELTTAIEGLVDNAVDRLDEQIKVRADHLARIASGERIAAELKEIRTAVDRGHSQIETSLNALAMIADQHRRVRLGLVELANSHYFKAGKFKRSNLGRDILTGLAEELDSLAAAGEQVRVDVAAALEKMVGVYRHEAEIVARSGAEELQLRRQP